MNLVEVQKSDERNEVDFDQYIFQHRGGSKPVVVRFIPVMIPSNLLSWLRVKL